MSIGSVGGVSPKEVLCMSEFWLLFAFLGGMVAGFCTHIVLVWLVKREALSMMNRQKQALGTEKKLETKNQTGILVAELTAVLKGDGDTKEKLNKALAVAVQYPEATEGLLQKFGRFL